MSTEPEKNLANKTHNKPKSIAALKAMLFDVQNVPSADFLLEISQDARVGVQKLLERYQKEQAKLALRKSAFQERFSLERSYWPTHEFIAGVDEVGRGPLAGPVVAAAVILPADFDLLDVNDSKQLTKKKRDELFLQIVAQATAIGVGVESARMIDKVNIYEATRLAMAQAVDQLDVRPNLLLVDAMQVPVPVEQVRLIKGDTKSNSIAAASIVAKVMRDRLMDSYDLLYPGYGFAKNAGYGTKEHLEALAKLGASPTHRRSFQPVPQYDFNGEIE